MPKKTRKQKLIAAYRQKIQLLQQNQRVTFQRQISKNLPLTQPEIKSPSLKINQDVSEDIALKKFFIQDFVKSIFLISFVIGLEIVLYFVSIKR